jgi:hypothetical protein
MTTELDELKAENAKLTDRIEKLEKEVNPPPREPSTWQPRDYTENASMERSTMRAMSDAVPNTLQTDLRAFQRSLAALVPPAQPQAKQRSTPNFVDERPLESPPGIAIVDRLVDAQDSIDKAERMLAMAKASLAKGK